MLGFPEDVTGLYEAPTLFLSGAKSDYVLPEHRSKIRGLFPKAQFVKMSGAGHWLHAEKQTEFIQTVRTWLSR